MQVDPLTEKILIAAVSAFLSLVGGFLLLKAKARDEPRKRLSYDLEEKGGLVGRAADTIGSLGVT